MGFESQQTLGGDGSAPVGGVSLYNSTALGGFAAGAYMEAGVGSTIPFAPGCTLWLTVQTIATPAATWEDILSSTNGGNFGAAKGFWLARGGIDSGAQSGYLTLLSGGGTLRYLCPIPSNIAAICVVWRQSDNTMLIYANGAALPTASGPTAVAQDGTCRGRLGKADAFAHVLSTLRILNYAVWTTEATPTQATQGTYTTGNRYVLPASVTSAAVQSLQCSNWNGSASTLATGGSSPITYTVTGSPTLTPVAEKRIATTSAIVWDSRSAVAGSSGGTSYTIHRAYARLRFTTDALYAGIEAYSSIYTANPQSVTGLYIAGTWTSETAAPGTGPYLAEVSLGAGSAKAADVWEGPQVLPTTTGEHLGTFVQASRFATLATDGTTVYTTTARTRPTVAKRLVLLGDSIWTGFYATPMTEFSVCAAVRADFPTTGTGGVTCMSEGAESVSNLAGTQGAADATAAALIAEMDATGTNWCVTNLGTNDYGLLQTSAATFNTNARRMLSSIAAVKGNVAGFAMIWITPIPRIAPATPANEGANSNGSTMADFRAVIDALPADYPWLTVVDGTTLGLVSGDYYATDGIHLVASGDAKMKTAIKTATGY